MKTSAHPKSRWLLGFSRNGLVIGSLAAVAIIGVGAAMVADAYDRVNIEYEARACLLAENGNRRLEGAELKAKAQRSVCGYLLSYSTSPSLEWQEFGRSINENGFLHIKTSDLERDRIVRAQIGWTMVIAFASFAGTYFICCLIGWIFPSKKKD
jgi:hypothetical protein